MDEKIIEALKKKEAYMHPVKEIEFIQTHISWVFLTGDYVYKLKKPVKFSFLDFSTFEKRKFFCEEEVRLNRRLSPDIYLGVVPIVEKNGEYSFGLEGEIVEWAVRMKQLPQNSKMDVLLKEGKITEKNVERIAEIIADFHNKIETIKDEKYSSPEIVQEQIDDLSGVKEVVEKVCGMGSKIDFALEKSDAFIASNKELMRKRQKDGKIKDCHGDLHSGNIFIDDKIHIFDCIEFSKDFRFIDTASEIAFMAMDLDYHGREDLSKKFVDKYVELSQDKELLDLLNLYKCYRANVRAKIHSFEYEHNPEAKEKIIKYLELCERYAKEL